MTTTPQGPQPPKFPMVEVSAAQYAARHLQTCGRFEVVRVTGDLVILACPATAFNAAEFLCRAGYNARAELVSGRQYHVRVR